MNVNTRISKLRYLRFAAFAVGSVAVAGAAVLITASASGYPIGLRPTAASQPAAADTTASLGQSSTTSAVCTDFISHLSSDLGKSQSQVNAAIQKAVGETLADQVKAGKLTQKRADAITKKLAQEPLCTLPGSIGKPPRTTTPIPHAAYIQQLEGAAAAALGITPAQLQSDLAGGKSLSQIAAAQNPPVDEATFRSRLIKQLQPQLDAAVASKKLTQAQETKILAALQNSPIPFWNQPVGKHKATLPSSAAVPTPA